jgi:hypothetical protein
MNLSAGLHSAVVIVVDAACEFNIATNESADFGQPRIIFD